MLKLAGQVTNYSAVESIVTCVRFPWQLDVCALSRNNEIVQHCCVSLDTQQYWTALASLAYNNVNKQHCYARNNKPHVYMVFGICLRTPFGWKTEFISGNCERST
jgi:hypothetical protein